MLRALRAVVLVLTFVASLVVGVFAHVNAAPLRRDVAARVNEALAPLFKGSVTITAIGRVGRGGVDGVSARIADPAGNTLIAVHDVRVRADVVAIVRGALAGLGPIAIDLTGVSVRSAEVVVDVDANGSPAIAQAFEPRVSSASTSKGRGVRLAIDRVTIDHAWVHGAPVPGNALAVDADVDALRAGVLVAPPSFTFDVDALTLTTRGMPHDANAHGDLTAHLAIPSTNGGALAVSAEWKGAIAGVDASARAGLDGDTCAFVLDAPQISPDAIRAQWAASPIAESGSLHVDAKGTLTRVDIAVHTTLGGGSFDVAGPITVASGQHANLNVEVRALDLNAIVPSAPPSSLSAKGDVQLTRAANGAVDGETKIALEPGVIAGEPVPRGAVHGSIKYDANAGLHVDARISADEPGAPTVLAVHVSPTRTGGLQIAFDGDMNAPKLEAIPRLRSSVQGSSILKTHGVVDLGRGEISAKVKAEIDDFGRGGVAHARHASIEAEASGTLASPQLDVKIHGDVLDVAGYRFSKAHVEAHGPAKHVHVSVHLRGDDAPSVDAEADLDLAAAPTVSNVEATLARDGESAHATASSVRVGHGGIDIEGVVVTGLGGPLHASLQTAANTLRMKADARDLDVGSLARIVHVEDRLVGCELALDIDATVKREGAEGTASFDLASCSLDKVKGVTAHLDASMSGRKISGHAHADVPEAGEIDLTTSKVEIGGAAPVLASLRRAWGKLKFAGHMDLAKIAPLFPPNALPVDDVRGVVTFDGKLQRDTMDDMTPGLALSLKTAGLSIVGASRRKTDVDGSTTVTPPSWHVEGIDVALDSRIDGDSGFADVDARLEDANGELVDLDLKSATVPFSNLIATPSQAMTLLESVQFNARLVAPKRAVDGLPKQLELPVSHGDLEGVVTVTGSALKPMVDANVKLGAAHGHTSGLALPADFELAAHYDGAHVDAKLTANVKGARVLDAKATADVQMSSLLAGDGSTWTASARAHVDQFPVEALSALNDHQVHGTLSGDATLDGLHEDAKAKLDLTVSNLKAGDVTYLSGKLSATLDGHAMEASLRFDQDDGFIDAHAHAGAKWGAAIVPTLDATTDLDCALTANRFRMAILLPYVDNVFTELDARMDANVKAQLDPRTRAAKLSGTIAVDQGRFELASIGGEFHDASMKVTFQPDGVVLVENVKASGMSGQLGAAATLRLDNLVPVAANANVEIPSSNPLLLTVEGSQVGTIEGKVALVAKLSPDRSTITADVDVPTLHVELPLTSSQDVQALGAIDGVRIGTNAPKGFIPERLDAAKVQLTAPSNKKLVVAIKLGKDVEVKRGATLKIALEGSPTITVTDQVRATGQIRLVRGTLDVQGKSFDIENGTVTFVGDDPTNPQVVVTASWTAPDDAHTRVYANFVGPLKTGTVTLTSDPSWPKNEILALLLFGTPDGMGANSQSSSSGTTAGAGVAGGAAAQPVNRALESYGLGGVTTRVDTSQANPRPEVEVQIARDISLQVAYVLGTPPPGQNPDTTLFTLNWRFIRQWSLETTVGSAGTSILDLIWQYRY